MAFQSDPHQRNPNASAVPSGLSDAPVVDTNYQPVGKVTDVLFDDREVAPRWAVVKTGLFGGERFVPLQNAYVDEAGRLVVPFDKVSIKRAPKTRGDHVLSSEVAKELRDYYGIAA
jgi:PRC-barrel domain